MLIGPTKVGMVNNFHQHDCKSAFSILAAGYLYYLQTEMISQFSFAFCPLLWRKNLCLKSRGFESQLRHLLGVGAWVSSPAWALFHHLWHGMEKKMMRNLVTWIPWIPFTSALKICLLWVESLTLECIFIFKMCIFIKKKWQRKGPFNFSFTLQS